MIINLPHVDQVYMMFRSRLLDENYSSGAESLEVALYAEKDIPWDRLAFPTIRETLKHYFRDRKQEQYRIRTGEIRRTENSYTFVLIPDETE